ncbi:hypothetical protein SK128_013540, partial [Halocaridina rubra]
MADKVSPRHPFLLIIYLQKIWGGFPYDIKIKKIGLHTNMPPMCEENNAPHIAIERNTLSTIWSAFLTTVVIVAGIVVTYCYNYETENIDQNLTNLIILALSISGPIVSVYVLFYSEELKKVFKLMWPELHLSTRFFSKPFLPMYNALFLDLIECIALAVYMAPYLKFEDYRLATVCTGLLILYITFIPLTSTSTYGFIYSVSKTFAQKLDSKMQVYSQHLLLSAHNDENQNYSLSLLISEHLSETLGSTIKCCPCFPISKVQHINVDFVKSSLKSSQEGIKHFSEYEKVPDKIATRAVSSLIMRADR